MALKRESTANRLHKSYERKPKRNLKLRSYIALMGVSYTEIANNIHVSTSTLSQWMSYDLTPEKEMEIMHAVKAIGVLKHESQRVQNQ